MQQPGPPAWSRWGMDLLPRTVGSLSQGVKKKKKKKAGKTPNYSLNLALALERSRSYFLLSCGLFPLTMESLKDYLLIASKEDFTNSNKENIFWIWKQYLLAAENWDKHKKVKNTKNTISQIITVLWFSSLCPSNLIFKQKNRIIVCACVCIHGFYCLLLFAHSITINIFPQ